MKQELKDLIVAPVQSFRLPEYGEIPDVGLYLEQTVKYINGYLAPFQSMELTTSMVSNYVKRGLIASPVKKQYGRTQIACLFFVAVAKSVLSIEDIALLFAVQAQSYSCEVAYGYFRAELSNVLDYVFGRKSALDNVGMESSDEKFLLRNLIIAVAHKIYLDQYLSAIRNSQ